MELLIRSKFCASFRTGLNLFEVELPEQNLSLIPGHQEFGIIEETAETIDDLKIVTIRGYHGCAQQSVVYGIEGEEQRTIAMVHSSHDLFNKMDMRKINISRSGY